MQVYHFIKKTSLPFFVLATIVAFSACQTEDSSDKSIDEIKVDGKISSIIRSPVSADGLKDSINVAKMEFEETVFDFGEASEGDVVKHTFNFTNTGKVALIINDAHSTCGCTIPKWPKDPIPPGTSGKIDVEFNTKAKTKNQEKPVIINANTYPSVSKVYLKGYVRPKPVSGE